MRMCYYIDKQSAVTWHKHKFLSGGIKVIHLRKTMKIIDKIFFKELQIKTEFFCHLTSGSLDHLFLSTYYVIT